MLISIKLELANQKFKTLLVTSLLKVGLCISSVIRFCIASMTYSMHIQSLMTADIQKTDNVQAN